MTRTFSQKLQRKLKHILCTYMHICLTCNYGITNTEMQLVPNIQTHGLENTGNQSMPRCTWSDNKAHELDIRGIVHYEFVPTGQTVNQVYYLEVLKGLREKVRWKRPELCGQQIMDLASQQCTCSHGTVCKEVFSY